MVLKVDLSWGCQRLFGPSPKISWGPLILTTAQSIESPLMPFRKKKVRKLVHDHRANERQCRNVKPGGMPGCRAHAFNHPINTCSCCLSHSHVVRLTWDGVNTDRLNNTHQRWSYSWYYWGGCVGVFLFCFLMWEHRRKQSHCGTETLGSYWGRPWKISSDGRVWH